MEQLSVSHSSSDSALARLCEKLADGSGVIETDNAWPSEQLKLCGEAGVYQWFLSRQWGGQEWEEQELVRGYVRLSTACLTTAFIITQRTGACRRIEASENRWLKSHLLPKLAGAESFATVGISHLTTSHRHLKRSVLSASQTAKGFVLEGFSPWVTGGIHADHILVGATLDDGRQILIVVPTDLPGVNAEKPVPLLAVSASHTGKVTFESVEVGREWLVAGPVEDVMGQSSGAGTGGVSTSALALGLSDSAIRFIEKQSGKRQELLEASSQLRSEFDQLFTKLLAVAGGDPTHTLQELRIRSNSLVLRATQASLMAAKGAGFVQGHPSGRWCREAMFFLVWSCPQSVAKANLCELAGLNGDED